MRHHGLIGAIVLLVLARDAAATGELFAVGVFEPGVASNLYRIDPATGAASLVGSTGVERLGGLAFSSDGTLYGYSPGALYTLDLISGAATIEGLLGSPHPEGGLSFEPGTGRLLGISSIAGGDMLVSIDAASGLSTAIGLLGPAGRDVSGLAFSVDGQLFGAAIREGMPDALVRIDPMTGNAATVGPLGTNVTPTAGPTVAGLDFDPTTGILYFSDGQSLYTVDTGSGMASPVGGHGVSGIAGLAARIPEPGSLAFAAMGLALALARQRRR